MRKPKPRPTRRYWESLSDEQLLDAELTTDDPEGLENVVYELPPGDDEPYVEYKYDLRGSEREMLRCVHGNHPHLAGFVMRKGKYRFFVGHICGEKIYGENFEHYTADFNAAVQRQDALRRKREIEQATRPVVDWMNGVVESPVFGLYKSLRDRIAEHLPWIFDNIPPVAAMAHRNAAVRVPPTLFDDNTDPELGFKKVAAEFNAVVLSLMTRTEETVSIDPIKRHFEALLKRIEDVLDQLEEVVDFFQPDVLAAVCALANEYDNPKKRKYIPGLLSITCKRQKNEVVVQVPRHYQVPDRKVLDKFRAALRGLAV